MSALLADTDAGLYKMCTAISSANGLEILFGPPNHLTEFGKIKILSLASPSDVS